MQVETQRYLDLVERAGSLAFWDIESTGLKGDYNSILCLSVKPYDQKPVTFQIKQVGNDQRVVREAKEYLESFDCWVTYYGKGFDQKMLNTRLLRWGLEPVEKRPHLDLYFTLKYNLLTGRKSQSHLLNWLGTPEQKMTVSPNEWSGVASNTAKTMKIMVARCESDCAGLEALYKQTRHIVADITR